MPYKLSATLSHHSSDVRAVVSPTNDMILSASRDSTAISWLRDSPSSFSPTSVLHAGSKFINAVAYLPPTPETPQGYVVVGGQDMVINIFAVGSPNKEEPDYTLVGHTDNVCALNVTPHGTIISGSWDRTAKVWKNFALQYDLKGHQQSVWAVLALDESQFLTASADKTIRLWNQHKLVQTYRGHQDAVRGLALVPDIGFASCSNDSEIRIWTLGGDVVHSLSGHTSFVYSVSVLPNGDIVSAGEDRSVRVWRDGECSQVLVHPAISVWTVSTMPNGDIVSGCSDGVVRVFSECEERWTSGSDLKAFDDQVKSQTLPSQQLGDLKKTDLPGLDALSIPGKRAGEVKMVRNMDVVEAHQWDTLSSSWQKIGEVVDAVGSGRKQLYNGKEYDYVFDVDIQEGAPPLKLPVNINENPYAVAQRFLEQHNLPMSYIDEVVRFIEKNTGGVKLGGDNDYVDPYTGITRYQPSSQSPSTLPASYVDPYTGASRYSGMPQSTSPPAAASDQVTLKVIPLSQFITFKQVNVPAMQAKLRQFDGFLRNEISTASLAMSPDELVKIDDAFAFLSHVTSQQSPPPASLGAPHIEMIMGILDRWPPSQRFPVMDLSRVAVLYGASAAGLAGGRERFFDCLFRASEWISVVSRGKPTSKEQETNVLLLFRIIANCLYEGAPVNDGQWVKQVFEALVQANHVQLTKTQRTALASILVNFSCTYLRTPVGSDIRTLHLALSAQLLKSEKEDPEAAYRICVAVGNILYAAKSRNTVIEPLSLKEIKGAVTTAGSTFTDERIGNVLNDIFALM